MRVRATVDLLLMLKFLLPPTPPPVSSILGLEVGSV